MHDLPSALPFLIADSSIPALLIFKDGQISARHVGVTPEATLRAEMQRLSQS